MERAIFIGSLHTKKSSSVSSSKFSLYDRQAQKICSMLKQTASLYQQKKNSEAVKLSDSAYWDVYDNILEIKYRSYTSPADIFEIENSFHGYSDMLQKAVSPEQLKNINKARASICKEVHKEAKILNKKF